MNITVVSAGYDNESKTSFTAVIRDADGEFLGGDPFPFGVVVGGNDPSEISRTLYQKYESGELVPDEYVAPVIPDDVLAAQIRAQRAERLSETDYLMQPDYPLSDEEKESVRAYRQALRDITEQAGFPRDVVWPDKPLALK